MPKETARNDISRSEISVKDVLVQSVKFLTLDTKDDLRIGFDYSINSTYHKHLMKNRITHLRARSLSSSRLGRVDQRTTPTLSNDTRI